jgi:MATE family multidrug resistance protein
MLASVVLYLFRHPELRPFRAVGLRPEWGVLRRILGLGLPIGSQLGMEVGLFSFTAVMMGWLGAIPLGAHQVTLNIAATTFMVALGTSLAGSIRVGQHVGAGRGDGVRRAALGTYLLAAGFMSLCALLFLAVPRGLIGLYTSDPGILELGTRLLLVAAIFQVFDGMQVAGTAILRGAGDTRVPMLLAALGYWVVGMPVGYLLGFHTSLGPVGVWVGLSTGLAAVGVMLALRVRRMVRRGPRGWAAPAAQGLTAGAA